MNNTEIKKEKINLIWSATKIIALLVACFCIVAKIMQWGVFNDDNADAYVLTTESSTVKPTVVYDTNADGEIIITDEGMYYSLVGEEMCIPYASIYSVDISDTQYLQFQEEMSPSIIYTVERELPNGTPNEKILRCAYYSAPHTEAALNKILGVTLSSNWRTEDVYVPSEAKNQQEYSYNGYTSNGAYADMEY